jgi:CHAD domain-containing protein
VAKAKPVVGIEAQASTATNARKIARTRLEELMIWGRYAHDPQRVNELHDLRIAAKRLRYTLEIFSDVVPEGMNVVLEEVTQIQEELGNLHDGDVMIALLNVCLQQQQENSNGVTQHKNNEKQAHDAAIAAQQQAGKHLINNVELVTYLLDVRTAPSQEQRQGLEQLLIHTKQRREEEYEAFRMHWDRLQAQDFQREVLDLLDV